MELDGKMLAGILGRNWWVLLLRGIFAILFGILAWFYPGITLLTVVVLFGLFSLIDGILGIFSAIAGRKTNDDWWVLLFGGLIGVGIGALTLTVPGVTAFVLLFYIAIWAIGTGILEIIAAIRLRKEIKGEFMLILAGLASVLFGIVLVIQPGAGILALLWLMASYAVLFGILLVVLAFRVRRFNGRFDQ